mmetsp:Transcript_105308/g.181629  ORF Transcript_105308/g.181629 Transcript_105308/m.181629 type:complete len:362 (-) Transcript_105308:211-1296(-)
MTQTLPPGYQVVDVQMRHSNGAPFHHGFASAAPRGYMPIAQSSVRRSHVMPLGHGLQPYNRQPGNVISVEYKDARTGATLSGLPTGHNEVVAYEGPNGHVVQPARVEPVVSHARKPPPPAVPYRCRYTGTRQTTYASPAAPVGGSLPRSRATSYNASGILPEARDFYGPPPHYIPPEEDYSAFAIWEDTLEKKMSMQSLGGPGSGVPEEEEEKAVLAFRQYDTDHNGFLDIYEFMAAMKALGFGTTYKDAQELFEGIDQDQGGAIEEAEFVNYYLGHFDAIQNHQDPNVRAREVFRRYDTDANGRLDINEFVGAMMELGLGYSAEDAEHVFSCFDTDGGGLIEEDEFVEQYLEQHAMGIVP